MSSWKTNLNVFLLTMKNIAYNSDDHIAHTDADLFGAFSFINEVEIFYWSNCFNLVNCLLYLVNVENIF